MELRATSDVLLAAIDELRDLEERKRAVAPDDPEFAALATRVDDLARTIYEQSGRQRQLAEGPMPPEVAATPLAEQDPARSMATILDEWRAAERRLAMAPPDSDEARAAEADTIAMREAYRRAWEERSASD
jgi:hypothetical protein